MIDMLGIYISVPLYTAGWLLLGTDITLRLLIFHLLVVPLVFKFSRYFRRTLIFANFVQWPYFFDYDNPGQTGLEGARNLSVEYESKVDHCRIKIGIWHVLPKSAYERLKGNFSGSVGKEELHRLLDEELANSDTPIVVYFHGNSNNRATAHRILLYQFFQRMNYHTITFDYRGYGDSTMVNPTEAGVVEDSLVVYEWLLNTTRRNGLKPPIFFWGHSLGTGISSSLIGNLENLSRDILDRSPLPLPNGLILEAPFNNIADEVACFPLSRMVSWLPYFDTMFVEPFRQHKQQRFRSDANLGRAVHLPILHMHAKDDYIILFKVGLQLYRALKESRKNGGAPVVFHAFEKTDKLGHKYICLAPNLEKIVGEFVNSHL